jgi:endonuclease III
VTKRLGWVPARASREQVHVRLEKMVPPELYYPLHLDLIAHGRTICKPRPRCEIRQLTDLCYQNGVTQDALGSRKYALTMKKRPH